MEMSNSTFCCCVLGYVARLFFIYSSLQLKTHLDVQKNNNNVHVAVHDTEQQMRSV